MGINVLTPQRALVELSGLEPQEGEINLITWQLALKTIVENGGTGGNLIMGAIRPDAELVQKWAYDKLIVEDEGVTIPAYSTSKQVLKSSSNLETVSADLNNYAYLEIHRSIVYPIYNSNEIGKGRIEYCIQTGGFGIKYYPSNMFTALVNSDKNTVSTSPTGMTVPELAVVVFWNTNSTLMLHSPSIGCFCEFTGITATQSSITTKSPALSIQGSTNYFSSDFWNKVTDIRYQWIVELYRVPLTAEVKGWESNSQMYHARDCVDTETHTLS